MNHVSKKLADSLEKLKAMQDSGNIALQSKMLSRIDRERLIKHGFLKEVIRGWYVPSNPSEQPGDSTSWYASFWDFCGAYLDERIGTQWCLSPEQSIQLHIGDKTVPRLLLVRSPKGRNQPTQLIHNTSVLDLRLNLPSKSYLQRLDGVRVYQLEAALVYCAKEEFVRNPVAMRTALSMLSDASQILTILLAGGHSTIAGRIAGAFRNIGRDLIADNILQGMDAADYKVIEVDPFESQTAINFGRREVSPYVNRMRLMWHSMRDDVIANFPTSNRTMIQSKHYLAQLEDKFVTDAYHSLSIEGYRVSHDLIEMVCQGDWDPERSDESKKHVDAMAAKGYWDAFQLVKQAVEKVLNGQNAGEVLEHAHASWYFSLFGPSVAAGIIKQTDLAGYRTGPVCIRQSMHTPPSKEAIRDMMPALFDLIMEEQNGAVRVILGHFMFVYIHPYFDGNGRMGRFIMNLMMASAGFEWTIVPVEQRQAYMQALETASVQLDIVPFTRFIAALMDT